MNKKKKKQTRKTQSENLLLNKASKLLLGRKIIAMYYMDPAYAEEIGVDDRALVLELDDGNYFFSVENSTSAAGSIYFVDSDIRGTSHVVPSLKEKPKKGIIPYVSKTERMSARK